MSNEKMISKKPVRLSLSKPDSIYSIAFDKLRLTIENDF
jgi:hypothetical protein